MRGAWRSLTVLSLDFSPMLFCKWLTVFSKETIYFYLEMLLLVALPVGLLAWRKVRSSATGLFAGAMCAVLGFVLNRLNVSITGMEWSSGATYKPSWMEWSVTLAFAAAGFALSALAVKNLPVFQRVHEPATRWGFAFGSHGRPWGGESDRKAKAAGEAEEIPVVAG